MAGGRGASYNQTGMGGSGIACPGYCALTFDIGVVVFLPV